MDNTGFGSGKATILACFMAVLFTLLSVASPQVVAGYGWAGGVVNPIGASIGTAVAASPDGELIASSHHDSLVIVDTHRRVAVYSTTMMDVITGLEFSPNSQYLLVGLESVLPSTPALIVLQVSDWQQVHFNEDGRSVSAIAVNHDDTTYAIPNEDGGFTEWSMEDSSFIRTHSTGHSGTISCISYSSDSSRILSGSSDGVVIVRWRGNSTVIEEWSAPSGISDCSFSVDSSYMAWTSGSSLWVRHHVEGNPFHSILNLNDGEMGVVDIMRLRFNGDGTKLAVLTSGSSRSIVIYDVTAGDASWPMEEKIVTNHIGVDIAIIPDGSLIAVSTQTTLLTFYSHTRAEPLGQGGGVDTDQDGEPNSIDSDDDGDGIPDSFDIICVTAKDCHLYPNEESIRRIGVHVDGQIVTVTDTLHLNSTQSTAIRILASDSNVQDFVVDVVEANLMQEMLCSQHDVQDVMGRWVSGLTIEGQSFSADSVHCFLKGGLEGRTTLDKTTMIEITWTIRGRIANPVTTPYNVTISEGIPTPDHTVALIIPVFPAHVTIEDSSGSIHFTEIWHRRGGDINVELQPLAEAEPTPIELALAAAISYWYVLILCIFAVIALMLVLMRSRGKIDFELDDEFEEEFNDESEEHYDDEYDDADYVEDGDEQEWSDEYQQEAMPSQPEVRRRPTPPRAVQADIARKSRKRSPPRPPPDERVTTPIHEPEPEPVPVNKPVRRRVRKKKQVDHTPQRLSEIDESIATPEDMEIEDALSQFTGKKPGTRRRRVRKSK